MGVSCYELEFEEIKKKVLDSINELYFKDYYIIDNDVNERSITHKLAIYLQNQFTDYDIDCEYNRNMKSPKEIVFIETSKKGKVFPDIIVHKRGEDSNNLIVFEIKKCKNDNANDKYLETKKHDIEKLKGYVNNNDEVSLNYKYGFFLEIHKNFFNIEIYFRDTDKKHVIETRWKDVYFKISENQI